nr:LytTR family DNA-binding domain-containing protein [Parabacteroides goldsteinii]
MHWLLASLSYLLPEDIWPGRWFIRIHRSCIVNSEQIMRVELFGKESYQVRLKTGVCLRASLTGYKLLKERLSL